jgi:hypothetical protein
MAETLSAAQSEISLGQIASPEQNRHNSLVQNPFHAYVGSLERKFHKLQLGGVFQYMFCSGSKRKTVKDEAVTWTRW